MSEIDRPDGFWAVVEHHRIWLANDGPHFLEVHPQHVVNLGDKLTVPVARRIAREYGVARTIGKIAGAEGEAIKGLPQLVEDINAIRVWPDDLTDRAAICIEIARNHAKRTVGEKRHTPISGVSKLLWFCRPVGWTMFDRFARIALVGSRNDAELFYETLKQDSFQQKAKDITAICHQNRFKLFGERIIDKLLLFRGSTLTGDEGETYFATARVMNARHLELLPDDLRKRLTALAGEVATILTDADFRHRPSPKKHRNS